MYDIRLYRPFLNSLKDQVYHQLKREIATGALRPGERLQEGRLAARFQVSKTPVREALALLVKEGFVEVMPRSGYVVTPFTLEDIQHLFDLRIILEGAAAELAAQHITAAEIQRLDLHVDSRYISGDLDTYDHIVDENRAFHHQVAVASRNPYLADAVLSLLEKMDRLIYFRLDSNAPPEEMDQEHRRLLDALRHHDPVRAREEMTAAVRNAREGVLTALRAKRTEERKA
ncbi:MAG: GntR family transcriptional regulator [Chloroflexi bacterium]|nr:GntR family transcriptional regulator [Chloroflexota bacterium]